MAFYRLANLADLYDGYVGSYVVNGHRLLLVQDAGKTFVIENRCPHMDAPLATGKVLDGAIICRAHGIGFDLQSGRARGPLSSTLDCLKAYSIVYEGSMVGVDL